MSGRWRRWRAGRDDQRHRLATDCAQCGRWQSVTVLPAGRRRTRYWCQHCGAVVTGSGPADLRPLASLRRRDGAPEATGPASEGVASEGPALTDLMPAAMVAWVASRSRKPVTPDQLDQARIYQLYRQWDAHRRETGAMPGLPPFSAVVGALHDRCYRTDLVVAHFAGSLPAGTGVAAIWERVEHGRRWLARNGRDRCWIHTHPAGGTSGGTAEGTSGGPAEVDRAAAESLVAALRAGETLPADRSDLVRAALFGTVRGPGLSKLRAVYADHELADALQAYLDTGGRPLRDAALARLAGPLAPPPGPVG